MKEKKKRKERKTCQGVLCRSDWRSDCRRASAVRTVWNIPQMSLQAPAYASVSEKTSELSIVKLSHICREKGSREKHPINMTRVLMTFEAPEGMWKYFGGTYFRQIRAKLGLKMHTCDQKKKLLVKFVVRQPAFCLLGRINSALSKRKEEPENSLKFFLRAEMIVI